MNLIKHFVGGKVTSGNSERKGKIFNPATGEQESEVILASKADLDGVVEIAQKAFQTFTKTVRNSSILSLVLAASSNLSSFAY